MDTETQNPVPAAGQRCWRPCLINRATPSVYWIALSLLFFIAVFASSVTRFAPGSDLSSSGQAVMVVPNPANPNGPPRVLETSELAQFMSEHPGSSLAMPPGSSSLEPDAKRSHYSYRVTYSARDLGGASTEMTVRGETPPLIDFSYVMLRYKVTGTHVEPVAMVEFYPLLTLYPGVVLSFLATAVMLWILEKRLIDRPLAQGRWCFTPPLNRDWLVSRGVPFRFEPVPPNLDALSAALRKAGATVHHQPDQGALRSEFGDLAVLTVNLRSNGERPAVLEALIESGHTPIAMLLQILVAPLAGMGAVAMLLLYLLDPFSEWTDSADWVVGLTLLAAASACLGWFWLKRPGVTDQGSRLAMILLDTLGDQGAHSVPPPNWPKLKAPTSKWRRQLPRIIFSLLLLVFFVLPLLMMLFDAFFKLVASN